MAFLAADWLYIDPTSSLQIARVGDLVALVVFVAVAAVVSVLVDRLARRTAQVASGQAESEALAGSRPRHRRSSTPMPWTGS